MRNIVFALLAVNILFFLWPKENQQPRPPLTRGKEQLPMLIQLVEVDERPIASSLVPEKFVAQVQAPPRTVRVAVPKPQYTRIKAPTPIAPSVATTNSEIEAVPLATAAESGVIEMGDIAGLPDLAITTPIPQSSATALNCFTLGPFSDQKSASSASLVLSSVGATTSQRMANERRTRGYWVYLPSQTSREKALKEAENLSTKGFSDYFVVADGKHDNAISLGLFTLKKGSERRVKKLKSMGFDAKVEVRFTDLSVYWLDYETDRDLDWAAFIKENFPKGRVDQLKRSCA